MCGIVGIINLNSFVPIEEQTIRQMLAMIRHRGPDEFGIYLDNVAGLGSARLSIIDLSGGQQPLTNEDENLWIVFNGEIFNYVELRPMLEMKGHIFTTDSDTEVILHLFEEYGPDCLNYLNGQFAFVIWDKKEQTLFLARDRIGIRPLFYTVVDGAFIFGSEIKAILADARVEAEIDPIALEQVFTYWSPLTPRTIFKEIFALPPGHYAIVKQNNVSIEAYWKIDFPDNTTIAKANSFEDSIEEFRDLLVDATQIRLRADVPVGAYLSGGIDSSTIAAIIRNYTSNPLDTFSIAFDDPGFDESRYQYQMADFLGTDHQIVQSSYQDIGRVFPDIVWHAEMPMMRTAPAPMFLLSKLVRENNFKVVLTGEGADEFLGGYNIFKEAKVRRFWAKQPESSLRPLLLKRLYPYINSLSSGSGAYLRSFFSIGLTDTHMPDYSHAIRWRNTSRTHRFFSEEIKKITSLNHCQIEYPEEFNRWGDLQKAQFLEVVTFLTPYLLSSQGDRMGMANSVEGRFPFLDHRVVEFANSLPAHYKLHYLNEKFLLKKTAQTWLPDEIWQRTKRPYRAPIHACFFNENAPMYVRDVLSPQKIQEAGLFKAAAVTQLIQKISRGLPLSETDDMALAGIVSTQLVYAKFVANFELMPTLDVNDNVKVCYGFGEGCYR